MSRQINYRNLNWKTWLFKLGAVLLPLVFFGLLELLLRIFNYGDNLNIFVADAQLPQCMELNPYLSERYFSNKANLTVGNIEPFETIKPANTIRLFVLGESTTIGFPYMHNGAFHRWLRYRLLQSYPGKNFEIVNLSLTAVNSFTVRDIASALPRYQPDAVLIYCGHNEYYGAMGVASTSSFGSNPKYASWLIKLRQLRIIQLASNLFTSSGAKNIDVSKNLMERMVADRRIPYGSEKYKKGIENFSVNMDAVCRIFAQVHVPIFLSTVISNERDMRPFINDSQNRSSLFYNRGKAKIVANDTISARTELYKAKDYDELRFRAPEAINQVIVELSHKYPNVKLVDTKKLFESNSKYGIIGNNLVLEHVHPNLAGYALMSDAFYTKMVQSNFLPAAGANAMTFQQLKTQMPVTETDSIFGAYTVDLLKQKWPFNESVRIKAPRNLNDSLGYALATGKIKWNDALDYLMTRYEQKKDFLGMQKVAEAIMLEFPLDPNFLITAGNLCARNNDKIKAENYLERAFVIQPGMQLAQSLFTIELSLQHLDKALTYVDYGLQSFPANSRLLGAKHLLERMIAISASTKYSKDNYNELANAYHSLGQQELAVHYYNLSKQML